MLQVLAELGGDNSFSAQLCMFVAIIIGLVMPFPNRESNIQSISASPTSLRSGLNGKHLLSNSANQSPSLQISQDYTGCVKGGMQPMLFPSVDSTAIVDYNQQMASSLLSSGWGPFNENDNINEALGTNFPNFNANGGWA